MQKARILIAVSCACASAACGTEVALAVKLAPDAGLPGIPEKPPVCTSPKLTSRLSGGSITLAEGVRYKRGVPFFGFPQDDRIAFSTSNTVGMVAWLNAGGTQVHVTPLSIAVGMDIGRLGPDVTVDGTELSGLVALDDGFALLTRRLDPGEPIGDGMTPVQATYLVRSQNGRVAFQLPLTGTSSITNPLDVDLKRDFPNGLSGRLAFNGSHFGAYFAVRGAAGDQYSGTNGDKFVQVDKNGQLVTSWRMGCRQNLGGRLVYDANRFVAFCMSDGTIESAGLSIVHGPWNTTRLAPEESSAGYAGGNLGSALKVGSSFLVAWASRGVGPNGAAFDSHEPAVALVDEHLNLVPDPDWPFLPFVGDAGRRATPIRDAVNVHAAPYGSDKILLVWETIDSPQFRPSNGYSTGVYGGTHFRLIDAQGKKASDEEVLPDAIAPNGPDEIVQFPNGDLGWAYVPEVERKFQAPVPATELPLLPTLTEIKFVRLQYCIP